MAEQVRRELSELVRDELKDPRVNWVSFTAVKLSKDLGHAVIYFSVMNDDDAEQTVEALNKAAGFLRRELSRRIRARVTPALKFVYDTSLERGSSMDVLIARARASDADVTGED